MIKWIVQNLCSIEDADIMQQLLNELLTDRERGDIELRWELMKQLKSGKTQNDNNFMKKWTALKEESKIKSLIATLIKEIKAER